MLFLYPNSALRVLPAIYFGTGVVVWLFGRESVHFGARGLVYGLASHVFVAGLLRGDRRAIATSLVLGVSWETHLAATLIGAALAIALRRLDVPPKRYAWEGEKWEDDRGNSGPRPGADGHHPG